MDSFPAYFPLAGRRVVIVGRGEAAEAKARLFEGSPAELVRLEDAEARSSIQYAGAVLAFIAGDDAGLMEAAAKAARAAGALVNVVDRPELSDFITPAVIDRGAVVAAVSTGGAAPVLATMLRNDIEAQVPQGAGRVAALMGQMQGELRERLPVLHERRAFLRQALQGPAAEAAQAGEMDKARTLLREALAAHQPAVGRVRFVVAGGPADLLSLRASRALASADVLVADAGVDPAALGLARRDAERVDVAKADLSTLAAGGRQVVRLTLAAPSPESLAALAAAGVAVEVLAAAPA